MMSLLALLACLSSEEQVVTPPAVEIPQTMLAGFKPLPDNFFVAGQVPSKDLLDLGEKLFREKRLSKSGKISCNSCHDLETNGADSVAFSLGHEGHPVGRNSPTVFNAAGHVAQFWDGRSPTVETQALGPILAPGEMAMPDAESVVKVLAEDPTYVDAFGRAFPGQADPITFENVGVAIGAFERTLTTPSRWDDFLKGNANALSDAEKQGFIDFNETGCAACHSGALIGGGFFMKLGVINPWPNQTDQGKFALTKSESDRMVFKVPSLRNVSSTGPYFHDGSVDTLEYAVNRMAYHQLGKDLSEEKMLSIANWLRTTRSADRAR